MAETASGARFVFSQMANLTVNARAIRTFENPAPSQDETGAAITLPFVAFDLSFNPDTHFTGNVRVWSEQEATVRAIGKGPGRSALIPIADQIDARLHGVVNVLLSDGATIVDCRRLFPVDYTTVEGGTTYRHLGGVYRFRVASARAP